MRVKKEEKRFWVPTLITLGAAISFLGVSMINLLGIGSWAGWLDIVVGLACVWWGVCWYKKSKPGG